MRILFVVNAFLPESTGGTELHALHLAKALSVSHSVRILTRGGRPDLPDYAIDRYAVSGIDVCRINYNFHDAASFEWIWRNTEIDRIAAREIDSFQPDLVHIHHLTCLSTGIIDVVKDRGLACVMTLHDFWVFCPRGQRIDPNLTVCDTIDRTKCRKCLSTMWPHFFGDERPSFLRLPFGGTDSGVEKLARFDEHVHRVLLRCDALVTPSEFHRQRVLEFDLPEEKTTALAHGLEVDRLRVRRTLERPPKVVGFIGTVIPSKGVDVLIDAFKRLNAPDLELRIYGDAPGYHGDTGYLDRLKRVADGRTNIRFLGRYANEDLPAIMAEIDILVVPSIWWETFCLTIYEGLLSGAVVVASDLGAMRESLKDGAEGLLFRPGDAEDLARNMRLVIDDPEVRRRYSNRGAWIKSTATHAREMLEVYRRALERSGRDPNLAHPGELDPMMVLKDPGTGPKDLKLPHWRTAVKDGPPVTVFIPTWNGGKLFDTVLEKVRSQKTDFDFEVFCIDSGSKDETLDIIKKWDARLIQIPNREFNHGLTRNRAVAEAKGEIVALLTQDAVPWNDSWLANLCSNFDDPEVAGAYCHQLPRENCNPFQLDRLRGWTYGDKEPEKKRIRSRAEYEKLSPMDKYRLIAFDDVASSVRKSVMRRIPFERRQFGEDVAWGKQAILAGWTLVMDPRAVVVHSHNNPIWYEFKRVYLDHQNLHDLVGMHLVPRFVDALRFTIDGTRHLSQVIKKCRLPMTEEWLWLMKTPFYSLGQNMGQYLGAKSLITKKKGIYGFIDKKLKKGV